MNQARTITGRTRQRETSFRVRFADVAARVLITAAGIGTIIAISTVCIFLVAVVYPLFTGGSVNEEQMLETQLATDTPAPLYSDTDEYGIIGWNYFTNGSLTVFQLENGKTLKTIQLFDEQLPNCQSFLLRNGSAIFGFDDGTIRMAQFGFETQFVRHDQVEARHHQLEVGEATDFGEGMIEMTPLGQFRLQTFNITLQDPVKVSEDSPVHLVDMIQLDSGPILGILDKSMNLYMKQIREIRNIMTGKTTVRLSGGEVQIELNDSEGRQLPSHLLVEGRGDTATLVWRDGYARRYDTRDTNNITFAESVQLTEPGIEVTNLAYLIGRMTMVVGDSTGGVSTWFRVKPTALFTTSEGLAVVAQSQTFGPVQERLRAPRDGELPDNLNLSREQLLVVPTADASILVRQHALDGYDEAPVTAIAASKRRRMIAIGFANGHARLFHVTSNQMLADANVFPQGDAISAITIGAKDDFLIFSSADSMSRWSVNMPHPQTTLQTIFGKVWYEGFEKPEHVWQSTSGTDEFEPKYGLFPLIFGTLKATLYTMLIAVPIALLAAVYSSEFLHPRVKAKFKPTIEIMASLPSVVLGFLAALVFAPFVEDIVPEIVASVYTIPFTLLLGAFLWQAIPFYLMAKLRSLRLTITFLAIPAGIALGFVVGPVVESLMFGGDLIAWLSWNPDPLDPGGTSPYASGAGGWFVLLIPMATLIMALVMGNIINPRLRLAMSGQSNVAAAVFHLVKFLLGVLATLAIALGAAYFLTALGFDPRGSLVDTYIQRNSMVVGFVMGFAVIPIIYTLAEDALSAVPEHLRAASLGAGATPWQTATRIIIPTAMSGLFSAMMIGLGRAVGETMIVLMAAGNTPIMEWNIFSGFRTLSANIAVEMPEAVQNGTNYRMLFLAALTLFAMTFLVNTLAEIVRLRFRKRAYAL